MGSLPTRSARITAPCILATVTSLIVALAFAACGGGESKSEEFTSARLAEVLAVAQARAGGENVDVFQIEMAGDGTEVIYLGEDFADGDHRLHFPPGSKEPEAGTAVIVGIATGFAFSTLDPKAVDKMVSAARQKSGADDFEITSLVLRKTMDTGRGPYWNITYNAGGRSDLTYTADKDGTDLRSP